MKKLFALLLAALLLLGLTACTEKEVVEGALAVADAVLSELEEAETEAPPETPDQAPASAATPEQAEEIPPEQAPEEITVETAPEEDLLDPDGWYYSMEEVSEYLYTYNCLPSNFITKNEARDLGWEGGSVEDYLEGAAIGGDKFGNREGILPKAEGRQYYECDIDTNGQSKRGAKRIVFSNDGLIYYTEDHYASFVLLYGEE